MFTFAILYSAFYFILMTLFLFFLQNRGYLACATQLTLNQFWQLLTHYSQFPSVFKIFLIQLAGLPPVYVFFWKVNVLISVLVYAHPLVIGLVAINLLLGVFFYVQFFSHTTKTPSRFLLKKAKSSATTLSKHSRYCVNDYKLFFLTLCFLVPTLCGFLFFFDIHLICEGLQM